MKTHCKRAVEKAVQDTSHVNLRKLQALIHAYQNALVEAQRETLARKIMEALAKTDDPVLAVAKILSEMSPSIKPHLWVDLFKNGLMPILMDESHMSDHTIMGDGSGSMEAENRNGIQKPVEEMSVLMNKIINYARATDQIPHARRFGSNDLTSCPVGPCTSLEELAIIGFLPETAFTPELKKTLRFNQKDLPQNSNSPWGCECGTQNRGMRCAMCNREKPIWPSTGRACYRYQTAQHVLRDQFLNGNGGVFTMIGDGLLDAMFSQSNDRLAGMKEFVQFIRENSKSLTNITGIIVYLVGSTESVDATVIKEEFSKLSTELLKDGLGSVEVLFRGDYQCVELAHNAYIHALKKIQDQTTSTKPGMNGFPTVDGENSIYIPEGISMRTLLNHIVSLCEQKASLIGECDDGQSVDPDIDVKIRDLDTKIDTYKLLIESATAFLLQKFESLKTRNATAVRLFKEQMSGENSPMKVLYTFLNALAGLERSGKLPKDLCDKIPAIKKISNATSEIGQDKTMPQEIRDVFRQFVADAKMNSQEFDRLTEIVERHGKDGSNPTWTYSHSHG